MRRQLLPALTMLLVFTVITGIVYPLAVTGVGQLFFGDQANGALLERDGQVIGSAHIGQQFTAAKYFHPRPSSAGDGYDAAASSGSNLGPTNEKLLAAVAERVTAYRKENNLPADTLVPVDAVTGSGSGLDRHIGGQCQAAGTAGGAGAQYLDKAGRASDRGPHRRAWSRLPGRARGERAQAEPRIGSPLTLRR